MEDACGMWGGGGGGRIQAEEGKKAGVWGARAGWRAPRVARSFLADSADR